jgi:hypothetical protein
MTLKNRRKRNPRKKIKGRKRGKLEKTHEEIQMRK